MQNHDPRLEMSAVRARYNNLKYFAEIDKWHKHTANKILYEITIFLKNIPNAFEYIVINVGAGGNDFGLDDSTIINIDISEARISQMSNPVVANAELLPVSNNSVDLIICVGSVINYCDAAAVIYEFGRIGRKNSLLILEFESSYSAELVTQTSFRQSAAISETFFANQPETIWVYSPEYIYSLLDAAKFEILKTVPIHILSPWGLLLLRNENLSAAIARLDQVARKISLLTRWASNHLIFCEKRI